MQAGGTVAVARVVLLVAEREVSVGRVAVLPEQHGERAVRVAAAFKPGIADSLVVTPPQQRGATLQVVVCVVGDRVKVVVGRNNEGLTLVCEVGVVGHVRGGVRQRV